MAEPLTSRRRQQTASVITGTVQDVPGVWRKACGDSLIWNLRGPTRPPSSGVGDSYKPKVKWGRVGRESEGLIVLLTPGDNPGRGIEPCFDRVCGWR